MALTINTLSPALHAKLHIPPRPEVVCVLQEEIGKDDPDLGRIGRHISADVGLSGAILRTVNSTAFGLSRKVSAIPQAITLLGLKNAASMATALALRGSSGQPASMERFWDTAEKSALLAAHLARQLRGIAPEEAYTVGLFHDCGIPILMQHRTDYKETLARANREGRRAFSAVEEDDIGTHHGVVGYFLTRSWELPETLGKAILWHHDTGVFDDDTIDGMVRNYVGIIQLAEHVQHQLMRNSPDLEWSKFETCVLEHFGLSEDDLVGLLEDARDTLMEN